MKHVLMILSLSSTLALSQTWDAVGPYGGWINDLTADAAGNIYAATYVGGVFKTTNNGTTWVQIYNDTLIIDPRAIGLNSSGHIFIATSVQGFFRSTNGGASWENINNSLSTRNVRSLLVLSNGTILAGCFPGGVYQSTNNGTTFTTINNGLTNTDIISLAEKASNSYLFAATYSGGMFRSTDAGTSWSAINNGLPASAQMNWVGISPSGDIYASQGLSLHRSTNNGDSWTSLTAPSTQYSEIAFGPNAMYAATNNGDAGGVYKSTNGGTTWTQETGLPNKSFINIIASGSTIIAGSGGLGTYRSDGTSSPSDTWTQVVNGMANTHVVEIDQAPNGDLYAATQLAGVWRSTNDGVTWFSVSNGIPPSDQLLDLTVSRTTGTVFVSAIGLSARGYRSTDQGATWINVPSLYACTAVACNAQGHVFAGLGSAVRRSTNDGVTWTSSTPSSQIQKIADFAFERDTVYVATGVGPGFGTSRGVYRSTNNGTTWAEFNNGMTNLNVTAIAVLSDSAVVKSGPPCPSPVGGTWGSGVLQYENGTWITTAVNAEQVQTLKAMPGLGALSDLGLLAVAIATLYAPSPDCALINIFKNITHENNCGIIVEENPNASGAGSVVLVGTNGGGILRGTNITTSISPVVAVPQSFLLEQNYPNPFNPSTTIRYELTAESFVTLKIYDILGREVATLVEENIPAGKHNATWNATNNAGNSVGSGFYLYRIEARSENSTFLSTRKMILLR